MTKLCIRCGGTGTYLGNGMMITDCELCQDEPEIEAPSLDKIDRKSKSYQKAIKDIMAIDPNMSRKDAIKMFETEYLKG